MKILSINPYTSQHHNQNYQKNSVNFGSMLVIAGDFSDFQKVYPKAVSLGDKLKGIWFRRIVNPIMRKFSDTEVFKMNGKRKTQDIFLHPDEHNEVIRLLSTVAEEIGVTKEGQPAKTAPNVSAEAFRVRWTDRTGACGKFRDYLEYLAGDPVKVERASINTYLAQLEEVSQPVRDAFAKELGSEAT